MAAVDVSLDINDVLRGFGRLTPALEAAAKQGRGAVGDELLRLSQIEVPIDEGTLANTGVSQQDGDDHIVGYNTPYAAKLHENPGFSFQRGRKGKYLEDPIKHNLSPFTEIFGSEVRSKLK